MWTGVLCVIISLTTTISTVRCDNQTLPSADCTNSSDSNVSFSRPLAQRKKGQQKSVHLIGLIDVHEGINCHLLRPSGVEQLMMTIAVLENQMTATDVDLTHLAFDVYDTCSSSSVALRNLIQALRIAEDLKKNCDTKPYLGVIGPMNPTIQQETENFLRVINLPYFPLQITSLRAEIEAMSKVLVDLRWMSVALFASTKAMEDQFREEADRNNLCIVWSTILSLRKEPEKLLKIKYQEISATGVQVAIVLGSTIDLSRLYETSVLTNSSIQYWLLAGTDTKDSLLSIVFGPDHPVILFRKSVVSVPNIDQSILDSYEFGGKISQLNLAQRYVEYVNGCVKNISGNMFDEIRCQNHQFRAHNPQMNIIEESVIDLLSDVNKVVGTTDGSTDRNKTILMNDSSNETSVEIEIWTFQHAIGKFSKHKELQVGHFSDGKLIWDKKRLNVFRFTGSGWFKIPEFHCYQNCQEICKNFANITIRGDLDNLLSRIYHWKYETWVTILMTISGVGTVVAILTAAYLIANSCKEDFEDGCQVTNVILLVSIVFSYSCTILFMLQNDNAACSRRIAIVGVAYASMLAPILSRCFMIIAAEIDGIHSHISGFLQTMLSIFIFAVQVAMAAYYWVMSSSVLESKRFKTKCVIHTKQTIAYLSYAMLLCLLWLVASPFCIRSRRNNREGLLLHLGSIAVSLIWLLWCFLFFLLRPRWNEFTVCFGVVATATGILVVVFLPKVYRMIVSTAAREHGQVSMQPVIFASASSRSPNLSIYESINHGYNPDKDGYIVDVFRDEDDSPAPRNMTHL